MINEIFEEIEKEREYQVSRWGTDADDNLNEPNDFVSFINHYSTRWFDGGFTPYSSATIDNFRTSMVKAATLAVAAIESIDRQRDEGGHTFYENTVSEQAVGA